MVDTKPVPKVISPHVLNFQVNGNPLKGADGKPRLPTKEEFAAFVERARKTRKSGSVTAKPSKQP